MRTLTVRRLITESIVQKIFSFIILCVSFPVNANAELIERVVAIVNKDVILLSEFESAYKINKAKYSDAKEEHVINEMVDRQLIMQEAKKIKFDSPVIGEEHPGINDAYIDWFIEKRIKAFIHIPYNKIEAYYMMNRNQYDDREFYDVKNEIEEYLITEELRYKVKEYIKTLRERAYIRIQLEEEH